MQPTRRKSKNVGRLLFQFRNRSSTKFQTKINLIDYQVVKPAVGEKILCVQRRHKISLLSSLAQQILIFFLFFMIMLVSVSFINNSIPMLINSKILIIYLSLLILTITLLSTIYTYLHWYYEYYIITNKSIIHRFCFRIAGPFSKRVYGEKMNIREIIRRPSNLIYDFLKIQDVYIYFRRLEREKPFIFKTPQNSQEIADQINSLATSMRNSQIKYD